MEGYLHYRLNTNPTTLDPALIVDVTGGLIAAKIFNGLVKIGDDLQIIPDIAERWEITPDGLTYVFKLRHGIKFSNGREIKAQDFKYSFERLLNPSTKSPNTWVLEKISGARAFIEGKSPEITGLRVIDDYTLQISLEKSFSPFLKLLSMTAAYVIPKEEVEKLGPDFSSHPVGTGLYVLKNWTPQTEIILERRADYFEKDAGVKGIIYRIIPEDLTAVSEFELGNIDILTIPSSEYTRFTGDPSKKDMISSIEGLNTYYLGFNCSKPPFNNTNARKAIVYAIDKEKIFKTIYEKRGRIAYGPIPDKLRKWHIQNKYEYNPELAKKIIKEIGLNGKTINFYITADQEIIDIAEVIQSYIEAAGINVKIKQLEWSAYKKAVNEGEAEIFYLSWWADYPDPENFLFPLFHSSNHGAAGNRTRYTNHLVDKLIEKAQFAYDEKERISLYSEAEKLIIEEVPWLCLWHKTEYTIRQPWVKNYKTYPIYSMDKGTDIFIDGLQK